MKPSSANKTSYTVMCVWKVRSEQGHPGPTKSSRTPYEDGHSVVMTQEAFSSFEILWTGIGHRRNDDWILEHLT